MIAYNFPDLFLKSGNHKGKEVTKAPMNVCFSGQNGPQIHLLGLRNASKLYVDILDIRLVDLWLKQILDNWVTLFPFNFTPIDFLKFKQNVCSVKTKWKRRNDPNENQNDKSEKSTKRKCNFWLHI